MDAPDMFYCSDNTLNTTDAFEGRKVMLSGGMVYNISRNFSYTVPECDTLFVDSGGFQATDRWDMSYPYEPKRLFDWAESIDADYVAAPDFACEPELHPSSVEHRIERTIEEHAFAFDQYHEGDYSFTLIPVLQGYYEDQYKWCIERYKQEGFIRDYMAVGTVCKRDSTDAIHNVMTTIDCGLPDVDFHMFGMTLNAWKDRRMMGRFRSADTAAWNWGAGSIVEKRAALNEYSSKVDEIRNEIAAQATL